MSQSATWDALQLVRDARSEERADRESVLAALLDVDGEAAPDVAYVRCTARVPCPRFILDDEYDTYDDVEPVALQVRRCRARVEERHQMPSRWAGSTSSVAGIDAIYRSIYRTTDIERLAGRTLMADEPDFVREYLGRWVGDRDAVAE